MTIEEAMKILDGCKRVVTGSYYDPNGVFDPQEYAIEWHRDGKVVADGYFGTTVNLLGFAGEPSEFRGNAALAMKHCGRK